MDCKYLYIDNIKIDFVRRIIEIDGELVSLTPREFDVVEFLLDNMNKVVSRQAIQETVWGRELAVSSRTLDTHVSRIRSKLGLDYDKNMRIIPIYSIGYRLVLFGAATMHVEPHDKQQAARVGEPHVDADAAAPIARPAAVPHCKFVAEYH
ncbi:MULTISPECIES: winged helix-turn-helix domain-containing protein [Burkholderia]|uniref:Transcriptional regulator n=1 Tax=Burkholderia mayonis TaxID=1385591 RepID=A0A1B4FKU1_9BURK|nr:MULTISPECIES: winged helix-turn-helix domain-containing protein [Burkholderia]AOJ04279.1 transcriptional regulator [Burkholderia mayonis]KVE43769.1 transcriptional regulator [Burkholderia mayonis]KVE43869.1 transcriptional regulator [Burkholderia sp. BDU5]